MSVNGGESIGTRWRHPGAGAAIRQELTRLTVARIAELVGLQNCRDSFYRMLDGLVIGDTNLFNDKLQEWEDFHYHVLDRGIRHVYIKPVTPRLNGGWRDHTGSTKKSIYRKTFRHEGHWIDGGGPH